MARVMQDVNCRNGINLFWFVSSVVVFFRVGGTVADLSFAI
jgi:hypothetical protein